MILHLLSDSKFDSLIINQIEECFPGENIFMLFYPKRILNVNTGIKSKIGFYDEVISIDLSVVEGIIIHFLNS